MILSKSIRFHRYPIQTAHVQGRLPILCVRVWQANDWVSGNGSIPHGQLPVSTLRRLARESRHNFRNNFINSFESWRRMSAERRVTTSTHAIEVAFTRTHLVTSALETFPGGFALIKQKMSCRHHLCRLFESRRSSRGVSCASSTGICSSQVCRR